MMTLGVIGTAGRKTDGPRLSRAGFWAMYEILVGHIDSMTTNKVELVSGGAAWADHLAVEAFLRDDCAALTLHLPSPFVNSRYIPTTTQWKDPGKIANYYHEQFSKKLGRSSMRAIQRAIDAGATIKIYKGFFARNKEVGRVDELLAFTFGTHSGSWKADINTAIAPEWHNAIEAGLKDGGTAHTWNNSRASIKTHVSLGEILGV